ncbi:hypothetical protein LCGC14_0464790 [marine sediment metagenome]|uniref:Uncharacterized protein n=1 Tax=marine sediment metagenome TaxID=412755 RepID=A0A0F9SWX3_9ZZZZ
MNCVICFMEDSDGTGENKAEYIFNGKSLCREHFMGGKYE